MDQARRFIRVASVLEHAPASDHGADDALALHDVLTDRDLNLHDHEDQNVPHPQTVPGMHILTEAFEGRLNSKTFIGDGKHCFSPSYLCHPPATIIACTSKTRIRNLRGHLDETAG